MSHKRRPSEPKQEINEAMPPGFVALVSDQEIVTAHIPSGTIVNRPLAEVQAAVTARRIVEDAQLFWEGRKRSR